MAKPGKVIPAETVSATATQPYAGPPAASRLLLALICFLAGAAIMVIEISAYRLLAPTFGNSAYTWTALIGVVLISFSAGSYLGGWLVEKKTSFGLLGWLLASASVMTFFVPMLQVVASDWFGKSGIIAGPMMSSMLIFIVPGILLGAVSPVSLRLYSLLTKDTHVGIAAGTISMLGSLGSFVGTISCGFYLLSNFGVRSIFMGTASVLMVLAITAFLMARQPLVAQIPVVLAGLLAASFSLMVQGPVEANVIYTHDSYYHRIQVTEQGSEPHTERYLHLDSTPEGGMRMRDGNIIFNYQRWWQLPKMKPDFEMKRALFIGAGAFGMPERISQQSPQAIVDVCEIDPNVIETGRKFFKLDEFPNVKAHAGDARRFMKLADGVQYDFIFGDAYNGVSQIPVHLVTKEFFELVNQRLSPKGVFLMNVISAIEGPNARLLSGVVSTLKEVFPQVEIFNVYNDRKSSHNVIILASREPWASVFTESSYTPGSDQDYIARTLMPHSRWPEQGTIITDDFNPVDVYVAGIARELAEGR